MAFPRAQYEQFLRKLLDPRSTVYWVGAKEPYYAPVNNGSPYVIRIDTGTARGYGTSETRKCWVPGAQGGGGAYQYYVLQRMTWNVTFDVETYDSDTPGEDLLMELRGKLRWPSSIAAIECMGITTVKVGDVVSMIRPAQDGECFGAVLEITHGQCYVSPVEDPGYVIEEITSVAGTLEDGIPNPLAIDAGPIYAPPTIQSIAPATGTSAGGVDVTLRGFFDGVTGVTIGGASVTSLVVVNANQITCVTPAGAVGAQDVVVTNPGGPGTLSSGFTYT